MEVHRSYPGQNFAGEGRDPSGTKRKAFSDTGTGKSASKLHSNNHMQLRSGANKRKERDDTNAQKADLDHSKMTKTCAIECASGDAAKLLKDEQLTKEASFDEEEPKGQFHGVTSREMPHLRMMFSAESRFTEQYCIGLFTTSLGLTEEFAKSFWIRRQQTVFGDSETDLGWINLIMEEKCEMNGGVDALMKLGTAEALEKLGYQKHVAKSYAEFVDGSHFKDSEDILGWALLRIEDSNLFGYDSGNFTTVPNGQDSSGDLRASNGFLDSCVGRIWVQEMKREIRFKETNAAVKESEFEAKMGEMAVKDGHRLWFHGTTTISATKGILKHGINLNRGRGKSKHQKPKDFSFCQGFYVCSEAIFARSYCQQRHECPVSVVVFELPDNMVEVFERNKYEGHDLRFEYRVDDGGVPHVAQKDKKKLKHWERIIRYHLGQSRGETRQFIRDVRSMDYIIGPVSDNENGPRLCRKPCDGYQLCIRNDDELAQLLQEYIVGVVHFE